MTRSHPRSLAVACLLAVAASPARAGAQPAASAVAAESLFNEGRELMAQGRLAEACKKLEASEKVDPAVGTLFSLGECYEGEGRLASAWFAYRAAAALAERRTDARTLASHQRAEGLEPRLAHLVIRFPPGDAVDVALDGDRIAPDAAGSPLPVDPGRHHVETRGALPWSREVEVPGNGVTVTVDVPPPASAPPAPSERVHVPVVRRAAGLGLAAASVATLATGAVLGMQAVVKGRDANRACTNGDACGDAGAVHENGVARTYADAATVLFPVGAVLGAFGGYLLWTSRATIEPVVSPTTARLGVRISW